jgi:hypothetical protein
MTRRKGELSANRIDREWPYQVAVRADQIMGKNHDIIHEFCRGLSLCPCGQGSCLRPCQYSRDQAGHERAHNVNARAIAECHAYGRCLSWSERSVNGQSPSHLRTLMYSSRRPHASSKAAWPVA